MSNLRDRVNDAISTHPDVMALAFACLVLFLVVANFLWARRAARLEKAIEGLSANREALTHLLQRPDSGSFARNAPKPAQQVGYSLVESGPRSQREAVVGAAPPSTPPAAVTPAGEAPEGPGPAEAPRPAEPERAEETTKVVEVVERDATVRLEAAEIPASWRGADEDATPAAAAWAAGAEPEEKAPSVSPFSTMSFEPLQREEPDQAATPTFSFGRAADGPARGDSVSWAAQAPVAPRTDPAYAAWSEVTAAGAPPRGADEPGPATALPPAPLVLAGNGNGHVDSGADGHDNGEHGQDDELAELTPVVTQTEHAPAAASNTPAPAGPAGGILLVEDDDNVAKVYRIVLESRGHTVRLASDGVAALDEVRRGRPDLVLLDVMMPRMNGILFLQSLRAQADLRDVPVVILSNFREPRLVNRAMALGALEYVVKAQTRPEAIVNAVPRWMAGERAFSA